MEGVGLFADGELITSGIGAEIMGGPLKSLRRLVNHLVREGDHLRAGQLIIPGSAVELRMVEQNDRAAARFTNVGSVEAVFEGPPAAVEQLLRFCDRGPAGARVERVETREEPPRGLQGFHIAPGPPLGEAIAD